MIRSILIDATHFLAEHPTGVENYTSSLLPLLSQKLTRQKIAVSWIGHSLSPLSLPPKVRWIKSQYRTWWSQISLKKVLEQENPDLFFTPSGIPPLLYRGKTVFTIHDLSVYLFPEVYTWGQRLRLTVLSKRAARQAVRLLTPSSYTKQQVEHLWEIEAQKIIVIPHGLTSFPDKEEHITGLGEVPFFLVLGRIESKKNLEPVIAAFSRLSGTTTVQLVLAGEAGYGSTRIRQVIQDFPPFTGSQIILPGYVSPGQKKWLLRKAVACLVSGLGEGFGLPILEAFAQQIPVICSRAGALEEIGKDGVVYVGGADIDEWERAMIMVLEDDNLRESCIQKGNQYVRAYTWEKSIELTAQALLTV